ncbi:serpin family protein [Actinoalloteichus hymeniacidonis]|uniref:Serine protease inhibitor n=1 Tax=Actinoalloteichus hymeniacidonis TaxID=340345 RepID=A0AAC9HTW3_9PSEU|nr:serpin family protein [Actinoalloteichus hymeniacidonis]AOS65036.1 serine protease inhibitor [Actinoalloteichus hymeniacidonis]MBB5906885.1 serpin B [Actinoalloteichus hymeniacidonis]
MFADHADDRQGLLITVDDRAHLAFALNLHRALSPSDGGDFCWSPLSVASALGLAAAGARGTTRDEVSRVLTDGSPEDLHRVSAALIAAGELSTSGEREDAPILSVANTLWTREDVEVTPTFRRELAGWPGGAVQGAPFETDVEGARRLINEDVAQLTRGLIPELLPKGTVGDDTIATLVNALYLKTAWINRFPAEATRPRPFHAVGGARDVPTMQLTERLPYTARDGWQVVGLPAKGGVEAVVLLPDGDLAEAEASLTASKLGVLLDAVRATRVELFLPKLRVTGRADLGDSLGGLGVRTMFTDAADFRGVSESHRIAVSSVLHESVLQIDEDGLEGAAATAVVFRLAAAVLPQRPITVRVDRPFLLLVRHRRSGAVYFLSRVADPS